MDELLKFALEAHDGLLRRHEYTVDVHRNTVTSTGFPSR
jgi:hypothetical protein